MAQRPRVLLNFASSADGKIAPVPSLRKRPFAMSRGAEDRRRMRELRASADAIMIGASNLRLDDPDLALLPEERERRRAAGERQPYRIVVTRKGEGVTRDRKIFAPELGGPAIVVHSDEMTASARAELASVATLVSMGETMVDISVLLEWAARELGARTLLCEGGGVIASELFAARAVDELYLTLVPRILGGKDAPSLVGGRGFVPDEIPDATLGAIEHIGDELYLRYDFDWSGTRG